MVIKFNTANEPHPLPIRKDVFRLVNEVPEYGFWVHDGLNEHKLSDDDYVIIERNRTEVITASEYANDVELKRKVVELVGKELLEQIIQAFVDLSATDLVKLDILRTIGPSMDMIVANKIQAARVITNVIPTTTNFTAARKNGLLALIDEALTKL